MKKLFLFVTLLLIAGSLTMSFAQSTKHVFNKLPYSYDALEPYIDKETMEIHYDKHHRAYYNNFMNAIKGTALEKMPLEKLFSLIEHQSTAVRNNAGGYWNHDFFWNVMKPGGKKSPEGELLKAINKDFGSFENFKKQFADAGMKRFGSGWAWLIVDNEGKLQVISTANQDNPLMKTEKIQGKPILCVDVWEHAYYLKYQNKRADYLANFWNVVNWDVVSENFSKAITK